MATRAATVAAKTEIKAAAKRTPKEKAQAKIYRSRGGGDGKYQRVIIFVENGEYGEDMGQYLSETLADWSYDNMVRDYVISAVDISREDFQLAFGG